MGAEEMGRMMRMKSKTNQLWVLGSGVTLAGRKNTYDMVK
jgi:hypothetical protein